MSEPIITFTDFSFRYKSQTEETLKHIDLTIYKGEKILILGPSGCGKSTLGNCINGLIPFSYDGEIKGSCIVAGLETRKANLFKLSSHVGTVQQDSDAQFIGLSVGEDIAFSLENNAVPRNEMLELVDRAAETVDMEGHLKDVPYDLSGGQKQKVALGGVLHNDVQILLFDEPLAALDPQMGMTAVDLIDRIHREQDKTVIIIEHRLEDVLFRHVDRIILINDGTIALDTTPDELLRSNVLKEMGIREPLYISALKNAGADLSLLKDLENAEALDISPVKDLIAEHFHKNEPSLEKRESTGEVLVEVKDVSFDYGGDYSLDDMNFTIRKGERISVIGKNGAGKSTMAKLLTGIIRPKKGEITFKGQNILEMSIREIGRLIGYVMQNPNQMIAKNIIKEEVELAPRLNGFSKEETDRNVEEALRMCDLYPMRNWPISVLSYGQKKRVTIASILCLKPDILIVDEPTAGQDYRHYTEIMRFLEDLNRDYGITILFITHDMHLAIEYTDRSIVFSDGNILADDYVYSVLSDKETIKKANLKETSLVTLAEKAGIDPEKFIHAFIEEERRQRTDGK